MTPATSTQLDALTPHQLISEIRQIAQQYAAEVPGARRNWPESIRARILALARLGIAKKKIAELSGIPAATVFLWCRALPRAGRSRAAQWIELKKSVPTPTVGVPAVSSTVGMSAKGTLSLMAPGGFVFEGLPSLEEAARLYRELMR